MMKRTLLFFLCAACAASAQSSPQLAGLIQDMALVQREVGQLRLEVASLRKDNESLRKQIALAGSADSQASALEALRRDMDTQNAATKKQILAEVARQIEALAKQMQAAFDKLADARRAATPATPTQVAFTDDYSKDGVVYVVKAGDTLGAIARAHGANIRDIQNANKIANPARDLQAGQSIFIPKPKP